LKDISWVENAYEDYTIHKQTYAELEIKYAKSEDTIRKYFDQLNSQKAFINICPEPINLIFDTTFFKRSLGVMVFRKPGKNISWKYVETEKLSFYLEELLKLKDFGFTFKSFTIDGRKGLIRLLQIHFNTVPIQLCHFHQVQTVTKYTTKNPKTECGKDLRKLILNLKKLSKKDFIKQFENLQKTYKSFLREKNEQNQFQHRRLRSAFRSIKTNLPYLFTFEDYPDLKIPTTTNSCDGSFGQWKYKIKLHRHLNLDRKKQMIDKILSQKTSNF
jgi:hypothetical protein